MKRTKKVFYTVLTTATLLFVMTGCGNASSEETVKETLAENGEMQGNRDGGPMWAEERYQGQITAMDGNKITIAMAEMPNRGMERPEAGEMQEGMERPDGTGIPKEGAMPPEGAGHSDSMQRPREGQRQEGNMPRMEFTPTGETKTIELTDDTIITINGEAASIEDLAVDDIIMISMDGDTVQSVFVMRE